jgi:Entner-Doudoroff aldolase
MRKENTVSRIKDLGLLAVLRGPSEALTVKMVEALIAGGVMGIEVTFSTPNAPAVVKELHERYGDQIVLGMGTLTKVEHAQQAMDAGASFLVSPHTDDELAAAMTATGLATMMGATTPSEVFHARKLGSDVVKLFPGSLGGPAYMKAIRGPLPDIPMMPTGGVRIDNIADWFAAGAVAVGAGGSLCPRAFAEAGEFDKITELARHYMDAVRQARQQGGEIAKQYEVVAKEQPTFYFVGVTTGKSSINKLFPLWMEIFGRPEVKLEGIDCKIHDDPEVYRQAVAQVKDDPNSIGGLITTHKMDLFSAAQGMFDRFNDLAEITEEISCMSKTEGRLEGHAFDPITAGLTLDTIIDPGYFGRTGGEVLLFGAGGSSLATVLHLMRKKDGADRPKHITVINRSQPRLDHMREMVESLGTDIEMVYMVNADPVKNNEVMGSLPEYSIVINATGMGKDIPGSPITDEGIFPINGIAWEFNYRGELDFMHQALKQEGKRNLRVEDGWVYFIYGWASVVAQVLHHPLDNALIEKLSAAGEAIRG